MILPNLWFLSSICCLRIASFFLKSIYVLLLLTTTFPLSLVKLCDSMVSSKSTCELKSSLLKVWLLTLDQSYAFKGFGMIKPFSLDNWASVKTCSFAISWLFRIYCIVVAYLRWFAEWASKRLGSSSAGVSMKSETSSLLSWTWRRSFSSYKESKVRSALKRAVDNTSECSISDISDSAWLI